MGTSGKKPLLFTCNAIILLFFLTCFFKNPIKPEKLLTSYPGMKAFRASGDTVILGSNRPSAQADEKPVSVAAFTYNFSIDTTEVTIALYRKLMGSLPKEYDSITAVQEDWPVAYVSWYDAILFCNARSIAHGFDSVYSYIAIERTTAGEIFHISGLHIDFRKNGYRLPTEAEWNFAARGSTDNEYPWGDGSDLVDNFAWYGGNAGGVPHSVATKSANSNGLYDFAGNVSEWINESKISLTGKTVFDYVGGSDYGATTKILKGGSFNHDLLYLRPSGRTDQYQVDAASRNKYTGFRCAGGTIEYPSYITNNSTIITLEPVSLVTKSFSAIAGSNNAKLVFVNVSDMQFHTLCFVDYTETSPSIHQFTDTVSVYNPTISPDGNWVCWASKNEGTLSAGKVFARKLDINDTLIIELPDSQAAVPRWYVDPATSDTFIVYVSSAQPNDQTSWNSAQTKMIQFSAGTFSGSPIIIASAGAYHGGRSADGTYLATGFPLLKMKNLQTEQSKILFYAPLNGKPDGDTSQVCNVSMSPGNSQLPEVLFLDFGSGNKVSTITKTAYHSHEYIFTTNFSGSILSWYQIPPPYYSWDYTEWSTHRNYAVASAVTSDALNRAVICLNLKTSKTHLLCEGTNLHHPYLWLDPLIDDTQTSELSLDSTGQYDTPHLSGPQAIMAAKMKGFWRYADSLDVIFTGSSVASNGIDPNYFPHFKGYNMGIGAGDLAMTYEFIKSYVFNHCPHIKIIGMTVDLNLFSHTGGETSHYPTFIQSKGYQYDKQNQFWTMGKPKDFYKVINAVPLPSIFGEGEFDSLGLHIFPCNGWGPEPPPILGSTEFTTKDPNYALNLERLKTVLRLCAARNIKVLMTIFPMHPGYAKTKAFGTLGPTHSVAATMIEDLIKITDQIENTHLYDAHHFGNHDFKEDQFFDFLHLCPEGAKRMSLKVDSVFQYMLNN